MGKKLTQEEFDRRMQLLNNGIIALDPYAGFDTKISFMCSYGHIWEANPANILCQHSGCPYCAGKKALIGINDLWTTRPDVARLLKNPNDGYKYMKGSNKKVDFICPDCGTVNNKNIDMVCRYGFACAACSDGVSYPNKFGRAFLKQLPISSHICEYAPKWAEGRLYDNYFEYHGKSYIVEMDGSLHYDNYTMGTSSLEERRRVDKLKDRMAEEHNIILIRIDCYKSDKEYIKNSILQSELNNIFDLSLINWDMCDINAQKNLVKEVCRLYKSGIEDLYVIKDMCNISIWAARKYVQLGAQYGWCDYTVEKARQKGKEKLFTPVNFVDSEGNIIHHFISILECIKQMKELYDVDLNTPNIVKSCKNNVAYKGLYFKYAN